MHSSQHEVLRVFGAYDYVQLHVYLLCCSFAMALSQVMRPGQVCVGIYASVDGVPEIPQGFTCTAFSPQMTNEYLKTKS